MEKRININKNPLKIPGHGDIRAAIPALREIFEGFLF